MSHTSIRCRSSPNPEQTSCEKQFTKQRGVTVSLLPPPPPPALQPPPCPPPTGRHRHRGRPGRGVLHSQPWLLSSGMHNSRMTRGHTPSCSFHCHSSHLGLTGSVIWPFCDLGRVTLSGSQFLFLYYADNNNIQLIFQL